MHSLFCVTEKNKHTLYLVFISTTIFTFIAHLHAFLNLFFSHDSLWLNIFQDYSFHDTHGRFFIRFWSYLTGGVTMPFLQGVFSIILNTLSTYILVKALDLNKKFSIIAICAIFSTTPIWTLINSGYIFNLDYFALAAFMTMLAIYILKRFNMLLSIPILICVLGIYQSFIHVATVILLILLIKEIMDGDSFRDVLISGLKSFFVLLLSMIIYYIIIKYLNPHELASYRNYNSIGDYTDVNIMQLLLNTYYEPLRMLFVEPYIFEGPVTKNINILSFINSLLAFTVLYCLIIFCKSKKIAKNNCLLLVIIILLIPFGMGFLYLAAKQYIGFMTYLSINYFFVLTLFAYDRYNEQLVSAAKNTYMKVISIRFISIVIITCIVINIHSNVIFANQIYTYKDLNSRAIHGLFTRIAQQMEQTEGYKHGEMKVIFAGTPRKNKHYSQSQLRNIYDSRKQLHIDSIMYKPFYIPGYFANILGINTLFNVDYFSSDIKKFNDLDIVKNMPEFPHKDSIQIIDDILVVKISN